MTLHRDFLMRMIQKLADAFFRIVAGRTTTDPLQVLAEIEDLLAEALGTSPHFALGLGPAAIDNVEPALAAELARLLLLHARVADEVGDVERALRARRMAWRAIERAIERPGRSFARIAIEQLREHYDALVAIADPELVARCCLAAHLTAVSDEDWAGAEDWLFFALDSSPSAAVLAQGRAFFDRLRALSDRALQEGGLTRDELADAERALEDYAP